MLLARATRDDRQLRLGASPRATLQLIRAAKAHAAMHGRDFVLPDDVDALAVPGARAPARSHEPGDRRTRPRQRAAHRRHRAPHRGGDAGSGRQRTKALNMSRPRPPASRHGRDSPGARLGHAGRGGRGAPRGLAVVRPARRPAARVRRHRHAGRGRGLRRGPRAAPRGDPGVRTAGRGGRGVDPGLARREEPRPAHVRRGALARHRPRRAHGAGRGHPARRRALREHPAVGRRHRASRVPAPDAASRRRARSDRCASASPTRSGSRASIARSAPRTRSW